MQLHGHRARQGLRAQPRQCLCRWRPDRRGRKRGMRASWAAQVASQPVRRGAHERHVAVAARRRKLRAAVKLGRCSGAQGPPISRDQSPCVGLGASHHARPNKCGTGRAWGSCVVQGLHVPTSRRPSPQANMSHAVAAAKARQLEGTARRRPSGDAEKQHRSAASLHAAPVPSRLGPSERGICWISRMCARHAHEGRPQRPVPTLSPKLTKRHTKTKRLAEGQHS